MGRALRTARVIATFGLLLPLGARAFQTPEPARDLTLRLLNPYQPDNVPDKVRISFLDAGGKALASLERPVIEGRLESIQRPAGARRVLVEAALFETAATDVDIAADHGLVLVPYAEVAVLPPEGASGTDVRLWMRRSSDGKLVRKAGTFDPSKAIEVRIPSGEWELVARSADYAPNLSRFTVEPGAKARHQLPRWEPGLRIRLEVVEAGSGAPVADAQATWEPPEAGGLFPTASEERTQRVSLVALAVGETGSGTDNAGRLEVPGLPVSSHIWRILKGGFRSARQTVEIRANDLEKKVRLLLRPSPDLAVDVRDLGKPQVPLFLEIGRRDQGAEASEPFAFLWRGPAPTEPPKTFRRIEDGQYRLDLKDQMGVLQERLWLTPASAEWQQDRIALTLVREPRRVTGRVLRADQPLEGVLIFGVLASRSWPPEDYIPPQDLLLQKAPRTNANGYYVLELGGPGRYGIGYALPEKSIDGTAGPVDLTSSTSAELDVHVPVGGLQVQIVSATTGEPVTDASLEIVLAGAASEPEGRNLVVRVDELGRYTLGGIDAKRAAITVTAPRFESKRFEYSLGEPSDETTRRIALVPVQPLRFRVADRRGLPVPSAEVWTLEEMVVGDVEPRMKFLTTSDVSGLAVIENPASIERPYFCLARGYALELSVVAAPSGNGGEGEVSIALSPVEMTYPLVLTGSDNQPVMRAALAFRKLGVLYPWALLARKAGQEGLDLQETLTSDRNGRIPVHELLAPGQYDLFRFTPAAFPDRPFHSFVPVRQLNFPLQTETRLTVENVRRKGG